MTVLLVLLLLVVCLALSEPLFVIIGGITALLWLVGSNELTDTYAQVLATGGSGWDALFTSFSRFTTMVSKITGLTEKQELLAIPFFVIAGSIMTAGKISAKLVDFARSIIGWLPGGLALATVAGCMFFAAISGSSPVTVIAIGGLMYPMLRKEGFPDRFSTGLVTTAGSLGILIPPSIPMIVYAIVNPGTKIDLKEFFLAGIGPGFLIGGLLMGYSMWVGKRANVPRQAFRAIDVWVKFKDGFWALMFPVVILGGIYSGLFSPTEAAGVSVVYALFVEIFIHGELKPKEVPRILVESTVLMGILLIIMVLALALNDYLVSAGVPDRAAAWIAESELSPLGFVLALNGLLLIVGAFMDILSAIMILVPTLALIGEEVGLNPIHLGVVFIVNLEIGYLTPPIGLNLFVSASLFRKQLGEVIRSVVPFIVVLFLGLALVSFVPTVSVGLVRLLRGQSFYEPFPTRVTTVEGPATGAPGASTDPGFEEHEEDASAPTGTAAPGAPRPLKDIMMDALGDGGTDETDDDDDGEPGTAAPETAAPGTAGGPRPLKDIMKEVL